MLLDLSDFELHNCRVAGGALRSRKGLVSVKTPTGGTGFVGSFSVPSSFTTEMWHYLVEQNTSTGDTTMRVDTEEYVEMFNQALGALQANPIVTHAVANNQMMVNSPAFSAPLYGLPGGGLITATKRPSINNDTIALDIPQGHITSFGDRFPIAQGNIVFFNDPPSANSIDPRTYVGENALALPGTIFDEVQGPEGSLYLFTSAGVYSLPVDAIGQGQAVVGSLARVPGIETVRSRNACATAGAVVVLQRDHVVLLPSGDRIDLTRRGNRRFFSQIVDVDDLRRVGELFATPRGFIIGFRGKRGHYLEANLDTRSFAYVWNPTASLNVVGTLRSRDGEPLIVLSDQVVVPFTRGTSEALNGQDVVAVASGALDLPEGTAPVVRHLSLAADNVAATVGASVNGSSKTATTKTRTTDTIIGTSTWSAVTKMAGAVPRASRMGFNVRSSAPHIEIAVHGGDRALESSVNVEINGQGLRRRDGN